jgi:Tfp pilus assembly protein FimT
MAEIIVVMFIGGVLMAITVPKLETLYQGSASGAAADAFVRAHELTRATAARFGRDAQLHIDATTSSFWVDVDTSGSGQRATIGGVSSYANQNVTLTSTDTLMCFDMRGLRSSRGLCQSGAATVVFSRSPRVDTVQITHLGKALR